MFMDEMECICGETLRVEQFDKPVPWDPKKSKQTGNLMKLYQEHLRRPDHKPTQGAWLEAANRIDKAKESAKEKSKA